MPEFGETHTPRVLINVLTVDVIASVCFPLTFSPLRIFTYLELKIETARRGARLGRDIRASSREEKEVCELNCEEATLGARPRRKNIGPPFDERAKAKYKTSLSSRCSCYHNISPRVYCHVCSPTFLVFHARSSTGNVECSHSARRRWRFSDEKNSPMQLSECSEA